MSADIIQAPARVIDALPAIAALDDDELDRHIATADVVEAVGRFLRVERGRRAEARPGVEVRPGSTSLSQNEKNRRSEEMLVARWYEAEPDQARQFIEDNGWRKCVSEARLRGYGRQTPPPISKPKLSDTSEVSHPARFSDNIIEAIAEELPEEGVVLDPFAGTGRIHEVATDTRKTIGVEIEPEWAELHPDTRVGNALDLEATAQIAPETVDAIATSPTYGNRLADSHNASDPESRRSYTHDLGRKLHEDNSGQMQWGEEYRQFHIKAYQEAITALKPGGVFVLNISDHIRKGEPQFVPHWHAWCLGWLGLEFVSERAVETKRLKQGSNAEARDSHEYVIVFRKPE